VLVLAPLLVALGTWLAWRWHRSTTLFIPIGDRSEFAPGACAAYGPSLGGKLPTIFIDPGHGGPDPGTSGAVGSGTLDEKRPTLAVAQAMAPLLEKAGYRVILSRMQDTSVTALRPSYVAAGGYTIAGEHADIQARVDCANAARAQLLLSIHFDAYGDPTVGGAETVYDAARPFAAQNQRFASLVQQAVVTGLGAAGWQIPDRGTISDTDVGTPALTQQGNAYGHLMELGPAEPGWFDHPTEMPGALTEPLFLTNPSEAPIAASPSGQRRLAEALVRAIEEYFAPPGRFPAHQT
jgi:N-acetylmuramoyl-L-alanine amidase